MRIEIFEAKNLDDKTKKEFKATLLQIKEVIDKARQEGKSIKGLQI